MVVLFCEVDVEKYFSSDYALPLDAQQEIAAYCKLRNPETIVEFGSGLSTVLLAMVCPDAEIWSFEQDADYFVRTMQVLMKEDLYDRVNLLHRPLKDGVFYDVRDGDLPDGIDLVLVDGPKSEGKSSRAPAFDFVHDRMNVRGVIYVDDANRKTSKAMIVDWLKKDDRYTVTRNIDFDRGLAALTRAYE